MTTITKEYIEKNLLTKNKGLDSNKRNQTGLPIEELYLIYHNIEAPLCGCGQKRKFYNFVNGYRYSCGTKCNSMKENRREKMNKTNIERYGTANPLQNKEIKEKKKQTNIERYGTANPLQNKEVREKTYKTNKERYGAENPSQSEEIKEKKKQTSLKNNGTENPFQSEKIKKKIKETNLERYGAENPLQSPLVQEKIKATNTERYGTENPFQSEEIKKKIKETNTEKYGFECATQNPEIQEKTKKTNIERYGFECPSKSLIVKEKVRTTNIERYGVGHPSQNPEIQEKTKKTNIERYGTGHSSQKHILNFNNFNEEYIRENFIKDNMFLFKDVMNYFNVGEITIYNLKSKYNITESNLFNKIRLEDRINTLFDNAFITNTKSIIHPLELDFYNSEFKFAIEYNGLMYHSSGESLYSRFNKPERPTYHLNKTLRCEEKGITLFHIFENEWLNESTRDIWISKINYILKRNKIIETNIIKEIDYSTAKEFIKENCLEQNLYNENIGLFYENELVMVISHEEDIFKVVSKKYLNTINGKEILINYIIEKYKRNFKTIINRRWHSGDYINYNKTYTEPNSFYFDKSLILEDKHQENYRKIWDCGNIILEKEYNDERIYRKESFN